MENLKSFNGRIKGIKKMIFFLLIIVGFMFRHDLGTCDSFRFQLWNFIL